MNEHRRDLPEDELPKSAPREGTFDAQLLFPTPFVEAPQPIQSIVKRDGRTAPFERAKIAAAIRRAGNGKGDSGAEHADSIANGVTLYLTKKLQGRTPSVEEVDDAVERVLIELGHAETALAYARHRDRRDRIRRFKDGDIDGVLREFEEARQESVAAAPPDALSLFVRTSDERLATWDRERIVDALIRETGMDATPARFIALQVERQILGAGVKTLTTSLVRELVDAKLIEFGLEDYRVRHRRLGVPLYDAERIICRPNERGAAYACDPAATDLVLAERVKREFALTQVFTREVADAHLRGDLHLHDLGFIDRLHEIVQPIEFVKLFGVRTDSNRLPHPPAFVNTLLSQIGAFNETLTNHFTNGVSWDAINVYLAPLTSSLNEKALDQVTRLLLVRLSGRAAHPCLSSPASELVLHWSVPRYLQDQHAVAARGEAPGQDYGQLAPYAREVARILRELGHDVDDPLELLRKNYDYYEPRTSHGSTLSKVVHAVVSYFIHSDEGTWRWFVEAMKSDVYDTQGGTTKEGIHTGVMAATLDIILRCFAGLQISGEHPVIQPRLPEHWQKLSFRFQLRRTWYDVELEHGRARVSIAGREAKEQAVVVDEQTLPLLPGRCLEVNFPDDPLPMDWGITV